MQRYLLSIAATLILILIILAGALPLMDWFEYERYHADIADNQARWEDNFADSYVFTIRMTCSCGPPGNLPVRLTIRDSHTVAVVNADSGEDLLSDGMDEIPLSIPAVFVRLLDIVDRRPDSLSVEFDDAYGFPSVIEADFDRDFNNDDVTYEIYDFLAL